MCHGGKPPDVNGNTAKPKNLHQVGTIVNVKRMMRAEDVVQLVVQGTDRFKIVQWLDEEPFLKSASGDSSGVGNREP